MARSNSYNGAAPSSTQRGPEANAWPVEVIAEPVTGPALLSAKEDSHFGDPAVLGIDDALCELTASALCPLLSSVLAFVIAPVMSNHGSQPRTSCRARMVDRLPTRRRRACCDTKC
jgi:hypothetical protein